MKKETVLICSVFFILLFNLVSAMDIEELTLKLNRADLMDGDVNLDSKVNDLDFVAIKQHYGKVKETDAEWDAETWKADIARPKDKINIADLAEIGLNYGKDYATQSKTAGSNLVFVQPNLTSVYKNENFTVNISIDAEDKVFAFTFTLAFDNEILKINSTDEGDFLGKGLVQDIAHNGTWPVSIINNSAGKVEFISTRYFNRSEQEPTGISGIGSLAVINFTALNVGTSDLELKNVTLLEIVKVKDGYNLNELPFTTKDGLVEVVVNKPPVIESYYPLADPVIDENQSQLFNVSYYDPDNDPVNVRWYLDEQEVGTEDNFTYQTNYESAGLHNITVYVFDPARITHVVSHEWNVTVLNVNRLPTTPTSVELIPETAYTDTELTCTASGSTDPDGDDPTYYYEFKKDGEVLQAYSTNDNYDCSNPGCDKNDVITCYAKAYDGEDYSDEKESNSVTIQNSAPILSTLPDQLTKEDSQGIDNAIDLDDYATDVDKDSLTYIITSQSNSSLIEAVIDGNYVDIHAPAENQFGSSEVCVKANDGEEHSNEQCFIIEVSSVNDEPVARNDSAVTDEDSSIMIDVLANDSDVEGPVVLDAITTQPAHGVAVIKDNKIEYTPNPNYNGQDSFEYRIKDLDGATDEAKVTVTIKPVNDKPLANDDFATTNEDNPIMIDVLANDSDVDNDVLTITRITEPEHGSASIQNNKIHYIPDENYFGSDIVEYEISDSILNDTALVSITILAVNDKPSLVGIPDKSVDEDTTPPSKWIDLYEYASDIEDSDEQLTFSIQSQTNSDLINCYISGDRYLECDKPAANQSGYSDVAVKVVDGGGLYDTDITRIRVNPVNDKPIIDSYYPEENPTIPEITSQEFNITASDVDNDVLEIKWYLDGEEVGTGNSYVYEAGYDSQGEYEVKVVVNDGKLTAQHEWQLTVLDTGLKIYLKAGKNTFSLPRLVEKSFSQLDTNCEIIENDPNSACDLDLAYYNAEKQEYVCLDLNDILKPGKGYMVNVEQDCYLGIGGEKFYQDKLLSLIGMLKEGWNSFGAASEPILFSDIIGDCDGKIEGGPLAYEGNRKFIAQGIEPGRGYMLKVNSDCNLGTYTCCLGNHDETCFPATIEECRAEGGAVMECIPSEPIHEEPPGIAVNYTKIDETAYSSWLKNLTRDVNKTGVPNKTYVPGTYDCDDFADDLEKNLTDMGYNATYTVYWWNNGASAHAVTDVHAPDGSLVFIEPQTGKIVDLDFDNDGKTEARHNEHKTDHTDPTDDNKDIEVYDNAQAASDAGCPRD